MTEHLQTGAKGYYSRIASHADSQRQEQEAALERALNEKPLDKLLSEQLLHICESNNIHPAAGDYALQQDVDKIKRQNFELRKQLQQQQRQLVNLQTESKITGRVDEYNQQIVHQQREIATLTSQISDYKSQVERLTQHARSSELALSELQKSASQPPPHFDAELKASQRECRRLDEENKKLQAQMASSAERAQKQLSDANQQLEKMYSVITAQDRRLSSTENMLCALRQALAEVQQFNAALEVSERQIELKYNGAMDAHAHECAQLRARMQADQAQHAQIQTNLGAQIAKYQSIIQTYETEQLAQQQAVQKCKLAISQQQTKNEQLIAQLTSTNAEAARLSDENQQQRLEINKLTQQIHQLQFCQQDVEILQGNNQDLAQQAQNIASRCAADKEALENELQAKNRKIDDLKAKIATLSEENAKYVEERQNGDYSQLYFELKESYEQLKAGTDEIMQQYQEKLTAIKGQHEKEKQLNIAFKTKQKQMEAELALFQRKCEQLQQSYQEQSQISAVAQSEKSEMDYQRRFAMIYQMMERQHVLIQKQQAEITRLKGTAAASGPKHDADQQAMLELRRQVAILEQSNKQYAAKCDEIQKKLLNQQNEQTGQNEYIEQLQQSIEILQGEKGEIIRQLKLFQSQQTQYRSAEEIIEEANQLLKDSK